MKRVYSVVGLLFLFVVAAFVPVLFWVYVGVGGFLVAAVFVRDHFVARRPVGVDARFLVLLGVCGGYGGELMLGSVDFGGLCLVSGCFLFLLVFLLLRCLLAL